MGWLVLAGQQAGFRGVLATSLAGQAGLVRLGDQLEQPAASSLNQLRPANQLRLVLAVFFSRVWPNKSNLKVLNNTPHILYFQLDQRSPLYNMMYTVNLTFSTYVDDITCMFCGHKDETLMHSFYSFKLVQKFRSNLYSHLNKPPIFAQSINMKHIIIMFGKFFIHKQNL